MIFDKKIQMFILSVDKLGIIEYNYSESKMECDYYVS